MIIKEKLEEYADLVDLANRTKERIEHLRDKSTSVGGVNYDHLPSSNLYSDKVGNIISNIYSLEEKYIDLIGEIALKELEILTLIDVLEPRERHLIMLRYIDLKGWNDISHKIGVGITQCHRIHNVALKKLAS
ncbi:MAG: hypothetical protein H9872_04530 [Candidatus Cellulosilyticum pullistercoris]|uniref:RNA polymerase sigma-70 region 4 domain-containing protein n=1 Tax=Candidatus Cellulosilyticum pullistercoris TaxID=2838521 RepID=A0A9E2KC49_9FIRM|nr:hypothetical protein [Candidatus Cellulosilyticum pullistercoris]